MKNKTESRKDDGQSAKGKSRPKEKKASKVANKERDRDLTVVSHGEKKTGTTKDKSALDKVERRTKEKKTLAPNPTFTGLSLSASQVETSPRPLAVDPSANLGKPKTETSGTVAPTHSQRETQKHERSMKRRSMDPHILARMICSDKLALGATLQDESSTSMPVFGAAKDDFAIPTLQTPSRSGTSEPMEGSGMPKREASTSAHKLKRSKTEESSLRGKKAHRNHHQHKKDKEKRAATESGKGQVKERTSKGGGALV